jgi:hypothetical protein
VSSESGEAGNRRCQRRRVEGGSRRLQGCSGSSASSSYCSGGLRLNSGERGLNWGGEGVEEAQEGEGMRMVCLEGEGRAPFYSGSRRPRGAAMSTTDATLW